MKRLNKLEFSPEKIMQNEELINLQGGYDGGCGYWMCRCYGDTIPTSWQGYYCSGDDVWDALVKYCYNPGEANCHPL
ncbi:MAG: hypothetical protein ACOCVN_02540 [bacterium]